MSGPVGPSNDWTLVRAVDAPPPPGFTDKLKAWLIEGGLGPDEALGITLTILRDPKAFDDGFVQGIADGVTGSVVGTIESWDAIVRFAWALLSGDEALWDRVLTESLRWAAGFADVKPDALRQYSAQLLALADDPKRSPELASFDLDLSLAMAEMAEIKEQFSNLIKGGPGQLLELVEEMVETMGLAIVRRIAGELVNRSARVVGEQLGTWVGATIATILISYVGA